jgi:hypothetical protein
VITIPTTELIGGITDVLPILSDPKTGGIKINWDGECLHFTAYDIYSGGTVAWFPGEGAEGEFDDEEGAVEIDWGGDDSPWSVFIWADQAKEILKLFKLPAKLWRVPVTMKASPTGDRLIIERTDSPRGERLLMLPTDNDHLNEIPDVANYAQDQDRSITAVTTATLAPARLGAFGAVRPHGLMTMLFGLLSDPVEVRIGSRYAGFVYLAGAKNVHPYSLLRDGAGLVTSHG